jgi:hypothetical protein
MNGRLHLVSDPTSADGVGLQRTRDFEELVRAEHQRLYGALWLITRDHGEAEDVMQEAFLRVWERWARVGTARSETAERPSRRFGPEGVTTRLPTWVNRPAALRVRRPSVCRSMSPSRLGCTKALVAGARGHYSPEWLLIASYRAGASKKTTTTWRERSSRST